MGPNIKLGFLLRYSRFILQANWGNQNVQQQSLTWNIYASICARSKDEANSPHDNSGRSIDTINPISSFLHQEHPLPPRTSQKQLQLMAPPERKKEHRCDSASKSLMVDMIPLYAKWNWSHKPLLNWGQDLCIMHRSLRYGQFSWRHLPCHCILKVLCSFHVRSQ